MSEKFDFGKKTERLNTDCVKWDIFEEGVLPMWVADMDFEVAPSIKEALSRRVETGIFGYQIVPDEFYSSYISWWKRRHGFEMEKDWIIYSQGVVASISAAVRRLTEIGNYVVVMSPVYNVFYNSILNNGRRVLATDLVYENGEYSLDFDDLEKKLSLEETSLLILCNPHNPIGKIWTREELKRIGELCCRYNVTVISDEIHCDIVTPGKKVIPFASVNDINRQISVTCLSPTKCFNIAGLHTSCVVIPDQRLRHLVDRGLNTSEVAEPNSFSIDASIAAFDGGEEWLDQMNEYVYENKKYVYSYIEENIPRLKVVKGDATYLMWVDISDVEEDSVKFVNYLLENDKVRFNDGYEYGTNGKSFIRINVATQRERVVEGMKRLKAGVDSYTK